MRFLHILNANERNSANLIRQLKATVDLTNHVFLVLNSEEKVKKLLVAHFFIEATQGTVIHPGKIHRISVDGDVSSRELWKVEVMVHGQKPSLWPRLWFMLDGENIAFLAIASHKTNYDNNEMDRIAKKRYLEMIDS